MKKILILIITVLFLSTTCHFFNPVDSEDIVRDNPIDPDSEEFGGVVTEDSDGDCIGDYYDIDEIVLLSPENGSTIGDITPYLSTKEKSEDIVSAYCFKVSSEQDMSNPILSITDNLVAVYTVPLNSLMNDSTYYWQVGIKGADGTVSWSNDIFSFSIDITIPILDDGQHQIGEVFEGGIVFYLNGTSGGLICAEYEHSTDIEWGGTGMLIGGTSSAVGTGETNTNAIVTALGSHGGVPYATKLCYDLELNGYTDWFLPSKDELNLMYENLDLYDLGNFEPFVYWSSTEYDANNAWVQAFGDDSGGMQSYAGKDNTALFLVRAVRSFSY